MQAMDGRQRSDKVRRWRCRSRAGDRASKARTIGKRQGQARQQDVAEPTVTGAMVFGHFLPKQKVTRSPRTKPAGLPV
ncbi:MAG: hypothetical protein ACREPH_12900 [Rhodanobacteraceae bacterium]